MNRCEVPNCTRPVVLKMRFVGILSNTVRREWSACARHREIVLRIIYESWERHDPDRIMELELEPVP